MGKGGPSFGRKHTKSHGLCPRCGRRSFHYQKKTCASCGYPESKLRFYNWALKTKRRRGQGTGRMSYLKTIPTKAANGFRSGTVPKERTKHIKK